MSRVLIFLNILVLAAGANFGYINTDYNNETHNKPGEVEEISSIEEIDLRLNPNEMGRVMVLMFHSIGEEDRVWEVSQEAFREDLEYLYKNDYYLVALKDFVEGEMDVPAGKTPVIITFDDGLQNNFNVLEENGEVVVDPESAVGIMEEFKKENPGFNSTATFYLFGTNPFRQKEHIEFKLNFLVENGYDIGNHTYNHEYLNKLEEEEIRLQLGKQVEVIKDYLPNYNMNTLSLPYGLRPEGDLEKYIINGSYDGFEYKHTAVLNVGSHPSYSWIDKRFDFKKIPRIRVSRTDENQESEEWYKYFEENYDKRYISDGSKNIITVPREMEEFLNDELVGDKQLYIYDK
jgi:peptidoglycan/xylan/chitin deacetylase (PgdA/CDA1 family)